MINMAQKANLNNAKKMVNKDKQASWWESQIKVVKKIIKWQIAWYWTGKLLAFSPIMLLWWILIASFLYPGIDTSYVRTDWPYMLISAVYLTAMMLGIVLYNEHKLKRLYYQICNWTIIIKQTKIVKFKYYNHDWMDRKGNTRDRLRNDAWYRIVTSDWVDNYKSNRFPYQFRYSSWKWAMHYVVNNVISRVVAINDPRGREGKDYIIIKWKQYSLWDEITVYIDSDKKKNYYMAIWL